MTSQKWKDETVTTMPIWSHHIAIHIPDSLTHTDAAFMYIAGGSNPSSPPDRDDFFNAAACNFAVDAGVIGVYLRQIPNQPFYFVDDPTQKRRSEDSAIAYTWRKFIENTSDPEILLRMPMTKAGVRAMDTVNAVVAEHKPDANVTKFLVAGGSKRGWVAWMLAAVDKRVAAAAPIVLSILNMRENMHHHFRAYGGWTFTFNDYYNENITQYIDDPRLQLMANIVDPYEYRERLTMPKVVICAAGDEFFLPDDSHYFFAGLPEPKHMMLLENTHHGVSLSELRVYSGLVAFYKAVLTNYTMPTMTWTKDETEISGSITVQTDRPVRSINAYMADTPDNENGTNIRDFRWATINGPRLVLWDQFPVQNLGGNRYRADFLKPLDNRWRGFVINALFDAPNSPGFEFDFTSEVNIIPDTFPYPRCQGSGCHGHLV